MNFKQNQKHSRTQVSILSLLVEFQLLLPIHSPNDAQKIISWVKRTLKPTSIERFSMGVYLIEKGEFTKLLKNHLDRKAIIKKEQSNRGKKLAEFMKFKRTGKPDKVSLIQKSSSSNFQPLDLEFVQEEISFLSIDKKHTKDKELENLE